MYHGFYGEHMNTNPEAHPTIPASLDDLFAGIHEHWKPIVGATLNGQHVRLAKFKGAFDWHHHEHEDEMFLVHRGEFTMEFHDRAVVVKAGEFIVVPRGIEHRPVAEQEVECILFEPAGTVNTGNVVSERTHDLSK